jgi:hypothetical protein
MVVTCSLDSQTQAMAEQGQDPGQKRVKGTATCGHCGNEADMWIDM